MISHEHKFIFIDIVKTAGTSINKALEPYGAQGKHHSISRELPNLPTINGGLASPLDKKTLESYFKFTIVRNPYDRLLSLFAFTQESALQKNYAANGWEGVLNSVATKLPRKNLNRETYWPKDFERYVEQLINYEDYYCDYTLEKYIPMVDWLKDSQGDICIDYVGKYENLQGSIDDILDHLDLPKVSVPKINVSNNKYKKNAIEQIKKNKQLQDTIYKYFEEDFEIFKYNKALPF